MYRVHSLLFGLICLSPNIFAAENLQPSGLTTDQLCEKNGLSSEVHCVVTDDGYVLKVFRCYLRKTIDYQKRMEFLPVILQHGILCSSDDFAINTRNRSLAFVLADAGYDVWLPNSRGNRYSNSKMCVKNKKNYWNFSWYEMSIYDLPAVVDYILNVTNKNKLNYIGHSQGTTIFFMFLAKKPYYNKKINIASLLSPVQYLRNIPEAVKNLFESSPLAANLVTTEFLPRAANQKQSKAASKVCSVSETFCNNVLNAFLSSSVNSTIYSTIVKQYPSGTSYKDILHYRQMSLNGTFGKYMDGSTTTEENVSLDNVTTKIMMHTSTGDSFADVTDFENLKSTLSNVVYHQIIDNATFTHMDFIWNDDAATLVYSKILSLFKKYQP